LLQIVVSQHSVFSSASFEPQQLQRSSLQCAVAGWHASIAATVALSTLRGMG
jgi:hypothetical protein